MRTESAPGAPVGLGSMSISMKWTVPAGHGGILCVYAPQWLLSMLKVWMVLTSPS